MSGSTLTRILATAALLASAISIFISWKAIDRANLRKTYDRNELNLAIGDIFEEIADLKSGSTRAELMKYFTSAPGFGNNHMFMNRKCGRIYVDVTFEGNPREESPSDKIETISRFYVDRQRID